MILKYALAVIATEAVVEIVLHGRPFAWLRRLMAKRDLTNELFNCGWCLSTYVAAAMFAVVLSGWWIALAPLAIHRLSNVFHFGVMILREIRWNVPEGKKK